MNLDETIQRLRQEHSELENQLSVLERRLYLTPDEQVERKRIQKLKLLKKDEIALLLKEKERGEAQ